MSPADTFATSVDAEPADALPELPSPDTKRWVVRRKAIVVQAVRNGSLTLQDACRRYNLSVEEFLAWQRAIDRYGVPGLRVTRLQIYRDTEPSTQREVRANAGQIDKSVDRTGQEISRHVPFE